MTDEERLRELGKIRGFETSQQRTVRILNKIFEELERDIERQDE